MSGMMEESSETNLDTTPPDAPAAESMPEAPMETPLQAPPAPVAPPAPAQQYVRLEDLRSVLGDLTNSFSKSIQPLVPKPPEGPKPWETERFRQFDDPETFIGGIRALAEHIADEKYGPLNQKIQYLESLVPQLYARASENPNYSQIQTRANEISQRWGIHPGTALMMAQEEASKQSAPVQVRQPPKHASSPDTRAGSGGEIPDSGPASFKDIIPKLRRSGQF